MKIVTRVHGVERDAEGKAHKTTHVETDDGRYWREVEVPNDLANLDPETLVYFGRGEPKPAGSYEGYVFPGGTPFLVGLCALGPPVYLEVKCPVCGESPCQIYARGGHRLESCWCGQVKPCATHYDYRKTA